MLGLNQRRDFNQWLILLSILLIISLVYSLFLLSVSLFLFGLISLLIPGENRFGFRLRDNFIEQMGSLLSEPGWWVISISFFMVVFGGLYSDDTTYWLTRLRIKAPFLLLPMAFFMIPKINKITYLKVHLALVVIMLLTTFPIIWHLASNYTEVVGALKHGRPIDTPISHIRYSLLIALAIAGSFLLSTQGQEIWGVKKKWFIILMLYFIVFLHFLAVRSGLAAFYVLAVIYGITRMLTTQRIWSSTLILALLLLSPVIAFQTIPSFKERVLYMVEDASKYRDQQWNDYSDAERILSIRAGLDIASKHLFFGTGSADLKVEMKKYFYTHFDKDSYIMPHNQFVSVLAAHGLTGLLLFSIAFFLPVVRGEAYRNPFFLALHIIVFVSLMVENTFETSVGVAFYLFFTLLGLNYMKKE